MFKIPTADEIDEKRRNNTASSQQGFEAMKRKRVEDAETMKQNAQPLDILGPHPIQTHAQPLDISGPHPIQTHAQPPVIPQSRVIQAQTQLAPKRAQSSILKGNTLLGHIKNVRWEHAEIPCDYLLSALRGAIYLSFYHCSSLKYHKLHPDYIYTRLNPLKDSYFHLILLCLVDIPDHEESVREITKAGYIFGATVILAWSHEESARYLEMYAREMRDDTRFLAYQNKPFDSIKEKVEGDYLSKLTDTLTSVKSVNKTDVITLSTNFGACFFVQGLIVDA